MTAAPESLGALRHRFMLLLPQEVADGAGGVARAFVTAGPLWGSFSLDRAGSRWRADRGEQAATYRVETRFSTGIDTTMRLALGDRSFAITTCADPDGRRRRLELTIEEITP